MQPRNRPHSGTATEEAPCTCAPAHAAVQHLCKATHARGAAGGSVQPRRNAPRAPAKPRGSVRPPEGASHGDSGGGNGEGGLDPAACPSACLRSEARPQGPGPGPTPRAGRAGPAAYLPAGGGGCRRGPGGRGRGEDENGHRHRAPRHLPTARARLAAAASRGPAAGPAQQRPRHWPTASHSHPASQWRRGRGCGGKGREGGAAAGGAGGRGGGRRHGGGGPSPPGGTPLPWLEGAGGGGGGAVSVLAAGGCGWQSGPGAVGVLAGRRGSAPSQSSGAGAFPVRPWSFPSAFLQPCCLCTGQKAGGKSSRATAEMVFHLGFCRPQPLGSGARGVAGCGREALLPAGLRPPCHHPAGQGCKEASRGTYGPGLACALASASLSKPRFEERALCRSRWSSLWR